MGDSWDISTISMILPPRPPQRRLPLEGIPSGPTLYCKLPSCPTECSNESDQERPCTRPHLVCFHFDSEMQEFFSALAYHPTEEKVQGVKLKGCTNRLPTAQRLFELVCPLVPRRF